MESGDGRTIEVALVCMPQAAVEHPSIALGELKACLAADGIAARVFHANLAFLDYVGIADYRLCEGARTQDCLVDWLFAGAAFPGFAPDEARYLDRLIARNRRLARLEPDPERLRERLRRLRGLMPAFVDWIADQVIAAAPRIVGVTSTFQQHVASLALLRRIRDRAPGIVTMMGGANCETVMGRTTHEAFPWVDVVVSGEADGLIAPLCRALFADGAAVASAGLPPGVFAPVHRREGYPASATADGMPRATTADIRTVPVPDYDDYFADLADCLNAGRIRPGLPIETARGCWWGMKHHCTFCGLNGGGMRFRVKPAARALAEMDALAARHGIAMFEAVDNIMAVEYLDELLVPLIETGRGYSLFYETKANLKPRHVARLAAAGVRWIQPGIESLHSDVLTLMRKGVSGWSNVRLLRLCRQAGIYVSWTILTGIPGERDDWYGTMAGWIPRLAHLQRGGMSALRYDRYSPYFDEAERYGLALRPAELYAEVYPLPPAALADIAYYFEDSRVPDGGRSLIGEKRLDAPGREAMRRAMTEWAELWSGDPPILRVRADERGLSIEDTRPCARATEQRLEGLPAALVEACDDAPARDRLIEAFAAKGESAGAVADALADLEDRGLVLAIDGRVLALTLRDPIEPLPSEMDFPGGYLRMLPLPAREVGAEAA